MDNKTKWLVWIMFIVLATWGGYSGYKTVAPKVDWFNNVVAWDNDVPDKEGFYLYGIWPADGFKVMILRIMRDGGKLGVLGNKLPNGRTQWEDVSTFTTRNQGIWGPRIAEPKHKPVEATNTQPAPAQPVTPAQPQPAPVGPTNTR